MDLSDMTDVVKGRAQVMLAALVAIAFALLSCAAGVGWWLAASDRDQARGELVAAQRDNAELRGSIRVQNEAVGAMQRATALADERGRAAQAASEVAGRRFEAALAKIGSTHAVTCADAMPAVNALLETVR